MLQKLEGNLDAKLNHKSIIPPEKTPLEKTAILHNLEHEHDKLMVNNLLNKERIIQHKVKAKPNEGSKIDDFKNKINNIQMLHDIGTLNFFKDFSFPIEIESLKAFCKMNEKSLHTKMINNLMIFERLFVDYEDNQTGRAKSDISTIVKYLQDDSLPDSNF